MDSAMISRKGEGSYQIKMNVFNDFMRGKSGQQAIKVIYKGKIGSK